MKSKNIRKNINLVVQLISTSCLILLLFFMSKSIGFSSSISFSSNNFRTNDSFGDILIVDILSRAGYRNFGISINLTKDGILIEARWEIGFNSYIDYQPSFKGTQGILPKPTVMIVNLGFLSFIKKM